MKIQVFALVLGILFSTSWMMAEAAGEFEIVPGYCVGKVALSAKSDDVEKTLGEPAVSDTASGRGYAVWHVGKGTLSTFNLRPDQHIFRVQAIKVTSPLYHTWDGIAVGSTFAQVTKAYGELEASQSALREDEADKFCVFKGRGISFEFPKNPKPEDRCVAVMVHPLPVMGAFGL